MSNAAETVTIDNLWQAITSHQGETFYTKKMLQTAENAPSPGAPLAPHMCGQFCQR